MAILLTVGCATARKAPEAVPVFQSESLSADLYVENNSKSYKLKSDIYLISEKAVRLDLRTQLDLPLASVILTDSKIEYAIYRDKKYFSGRPNPHALDPLFPLSVNVDDLVTLLREQKSDGARCISDEHGLAECEGQAGSSVYIVKWSKRLSTGPLAGRASKMVLELPERHVALKFFFTDTQKISQDAQRLMVLNVPQGFRIFSVPTR